MSSNSHHDPSSAAFFEEMYAGAADPWSFATSAYELTRYDTVLAALGERRFRRAFEPGCSVGVFTRRLAERCDLLLATDISPTAVRRTALRCADRPNVEVRCESLASNPIPGPFDLLVLNEIGYYFPQEQLRMLMQRLIGILEPDGTLLASHWLGHSSDHLLHGDEVHAVLASLPDLCHESGDRFTGFRLDRWTKVRDAAADRMEL